MTQHDAFDELDELDELLHDEAQDPAFRAAFEDAEARVELLRACTLRRKEKRLSQASVANLMGTTQSAVSELEAGGSDPRLSTLQRYARAVDCRLIVELHSCDGGRRPEWNLSRYAAATVRSQLDTVTGASWGRGLKVTEEVGELARYYQSARGQTVTLMTMDTGAHSLHIQWPVPGALFGSGEVVAT